ncbi:RecX family transcriptional regulator [Mucilaginibacter achroorhodeus]|uniref:Regulatory protein RecX n=1 Tax=Mucilaginibacter achroorhodeus TaxID=2599294 RepID=A0A563U3U2_9SPHI|nr:regulatory protein RecX [Mucilaginibacter achroorhodeus]TWR26014.1 RecX family transcriptional regulator [Mucilaginibacter achroorhodeus]
MDAPKKTHITDVNVAKAKAEHYCAYQERSQQEVRDKLYDWGLWPDAVEQIITYLIEENFLNEERFAKAYVKGKFNQKQWGRIRIKQGLKLKRVSPNLIKKAMLVIDADDYIAALTRLIEKKAPTIFEKDTFKRRYKLQQYAMGRGYEADLISDVLKANDL